MRTGGGNTRIRRQQSHGYSVLGSNTGRRGRKLAAKHLRYFEAFPFSLSVYTPSEAASRLTLLSSQVAHSQSVTLVTLVTVAVAVSLLTTSWGDPNSQSNSISREKEHKLIFPVN
jgi:hypothetical protein